jgi:hypothetical protein
VRARHVDYQAEKRSPFGVQEAAFSTLASTCGQKQVLLSLLFPSPVATSNSISRIGVQEVPGSNPVGPTKELQDLQPVSRHHLSRPGPNQVQSPIQASGDRGTHGVRPWGVLVSQYGDEIFRPL